MIGKTAEDLWVQTIWGSNKVSLKTNQKEQNLRILNWKGIKKSFLGVFNHFFSQMENGDTEGKVSFPRSQQVSRRARTRTSVSLLNYTMKKKLFFSDLKSDYSLKNVIFTSHFCEHIKIEIQSLLWQCCSDWGKFLLDILVSCF